jgi:flavodoxin-like protein
MRVSIVYESMYGNTAAIARAIGEGFFSHGIVPTVVEVNEASIDEVLGSDLLVVGGPTHAHGMTRATTRMTAAKDEKNRYDHPTMGDGLREWLDRLPRVAGRPAAAFDTRIDAPPAFTGAASKGIAHRLERHGFRLVSDRASFLVNKHNELLDGELAGAAAWGATLASSLVAA